MERLVKIRTRDTLRGSVRTLDRTVKAVGRGAEEVQWQASETAQSDSRSENEYAGNRVQDAGRRTARATVYGADRFGRWGMRTTAKNIRKIQGRNIKVKPSKPQQLATPARKALQTSRSGIKAARKAAQAAKAAVRATVQLGKATVKAMIATVRATASTIQNLIAAIAAGGWIVVVVILLICSVIMAVGRLKVAGMS